jgi:hypothetical protein
MKRHCVFKNCKCQHIKINKYTKLCTCNHAKCWHVKAKLFSPLSKTDSSQFLSNRTFARKPHYIFILAPPLQVNIQEKNYCNNFEDLPA